MKNEDQVQRAHDLLGGIVLGEVPNPLSKPEDRSALIIALDVLCWVLDHAHNDNFAANLRKIEAVLAEQGYDFTQMPGPPTNRRVQ